MAVSDSTLKFRADISELTAQMQQASRAIKLANSEFRASTAGLDKWSNSATGLSAKLEHLNKISNAQTKQLQSLEKQYELVVAEYGKNSTAAQDLEVKINNQKAAIAKTHSEWQKYNDRLKEVKKAQHDEAEAANKSVSAIDKQRDAIDKMEGKLSQMKQDYASLQLEERDTSKESEKLAKEIQKLSTELSDAKRDLNSAEKAADQFDASLERVEEETERAGDGFTVFKGVISNLISSGIRKLTSAITDQVDAAVSRVDAIHAYERTMQNLGYTSEEVAEASEKLADGIQGLPTTLPYIQSMQQQYTALTGSIDKATDITLALNNATLASGQGQEEAARAADHWYSILAAGKPEAEHWKEINKAMPAQMNQIAEAVLGAGKKSQDLFEAWKEGTVTTEEVEDALISLNKKGGSGLASFEQQAKDASKGIKTSLANIKVAIANTLAKVIEEVGYEDITGILDGIKRGIKGMAEPIANFVKFIIANKNIVLSALAGIAAGMVAMSAASGIMALIASFKTLVTAIKGAETAAALLNAELAINPVALVVGGVVALTTAVVAYEKANKAAIEAEHSLTDEQMEHIEAIDAQKEALDGLVEARESSVAAANGQASYLTALKEEYNGLIDANGKVKEGEEDRANFILTTLAQALGMEKEDVLELTNANGQLSDSIDKVIESKRAEATLNAYNAEYEEAIKNRASAYEQQAQAMQDLQDRQASFRAVEEEYLAFKQNYDSILQAGDRQTANAYMSAHADLLTAYDAEKKALEEAQTAYETATGTVVAYNSTIANYEGLSSAIITGDADKISDAMVKIQNGFITAETGDRASLERQVSDLDTAIANMQSQVDSNMPGVTQDMVDELVNLRDQAKGELDKLPPEAAASGDEAGASYAGGVSGQTKNVQSAATKAVDAAEKAFGRDFNGDGVVAGGSYAQGISGTGGRARSAAAGVAQKGKSGFTSVSAHTPGYNFSAGYASGILSGSGPVASAARQIVSAAYSALNQAQQSHSPSRLTMQSGTYFTQGYIKGIASQEKSLAKGVASMVGTAIKTLHNMTGTHYTDAGIAAADQFYNTLHKRSEHLLDMAAYQNEAKLADFDNDIEKLQAKANATSNQKSKASYEAAIATQRKYKDAYQAASSSMLKSLKSAMDSYEAQAHKLVSETITGVTEAYQKRYDSLIDRQDALIGKLKTAGSLFNISQAGVMTVNDLKQQTAAIKAYTDNLNAIKGKVSEGLFKEIADLGYKEGNAFMGQLLAMSPEQLQEFVRDYEEVQKTALERGHSVYRKDLDKVQSDYQSEIDRAFKGIDKQLETIGEQAMKGFVNGLTYDTEYMDSNIRTFVNGMVATFKKELKIKSPSRVMFGIGEYTGEGFNNGLLSMIKGAKEAASKMAASVAKPLDGFSGNIGLARQAAGGMSTTNNIVNNYNLVQNNTSPKSLSALDTYKARQRQIAMMKAATQGA